MTKLIVSDGEPWRPTLIGTARDETLESELQLRVIKCCIYSTSLYGRDLYYISREKLKGQIEPNVDDKDNGTGV